MSAVQSFSTMQSAAMTAMQAAVSHSITSNDAAAAARISAASSNEGIFCIRVIYCHLYTNC